MPPKASASYGMALLNAFMVKRPSTADAVLEPPAKQQQPTAVPQMTAGGVPASACSIVADIQALQEQAELLVELEDPRKYSEQMALLISTGQCA